MACDVVLWVGGRKEGWIDRAVSLPINHVHMHTQEVLCLHEVETLLRFFSDQDFAKVKSTNVRDFGMHAHSFPLTSQTPF